MSRQPGTTTAKELTLITVYNLPTCERIVEVCTRLGLDYRLIIQEADSTAQEVDAVLDTLEHVHKQLTKDTSPPEDGEHP